MGLWLGNTTKITYNANDNEYNSFDVCCMFVNYWNSNTNFAKSNTTELNKCVLDYRTREQQQQQQQYSTNEQMMRIQKKLNNNNLRINKFLCTSSFKETKS